MATYKFPQFNVTITDPTVEVVNVTDNIGQKTCSASVLLTTDTAEFGVQFYGFTYVDSWEDSDIVDWVNKVEMPKYLV
jgi:hypothetical protein